MTRRGFITRLLALGWYIAICIMGGAFLGIWADRKYETSLIFTFVGLTVGLAIAIFGAYKMIKGVANAYYGNNNKEKH